MSNPLVLCWSGGKDSAMALAALLASEEYAPVALLTTVTGPFARISMHGVRRELLAKQAEAVRLPLYEVPIPYPCPNEVYEERMREACAEFAAQGVTHFGFGDLFLEEVRAYRDRICAVQDLTPVYPLWGRDTKALAAHCIAAGYRALLCCVDTQALPAALAGAEYDAALLAKLGAADPCGENGEFHTFVYDAPYFSAPIPCARGETALRENRFAYADIVPL